MEKNKGGRPTRKTPSDKEGVIPTLDENGVDYKTYMIAQQVAKLAEKSPAKFAALHDTTGSSSHVLGSAK